MSEEAPFKFSIRSYKDDEEAATITQEEFEKSFKEKWGGDLEDYEEMEKGPVFDVILKENTKEEAFKFFKNMKHVRVENHDNYFPGYTFNVFFRLPSDKFEEYADIAADSFEAAKKELGEEEAHLR